MAEVASALEYLHQQRIIHRDIKPDNILLDAAGHAHITDFNVAIHYSERRLHTSVAGSMAYMAPEVVGRQGYTWCIDYWSLGVTMYELIFRRRPFEGRSVEKMRQSIMKESVKFPEGASAKCSPEGIQFVKSVSIFCVCFVMCANNRIKLLNRVPGERLGCRPNGQGIIDIHEHPWMQGIDWDALDNKELPPPFTPDVGCQPFPRPLADTHILYPQMKKANFDVTHELDEFLMVEKPLTHTKRKVNPDFEKMKPELRQMEEEYVHPHSFPCLHYLSTVLRFTVYDFSCNKRMSYYPHNQPIVNAGHEDDSDTPSLTLSTAQTLLPTATIGERSLAGSPMPDETQNYPPLPSPVQVLHH